MLECEGGDQPTAATVRVALTLPAPTGGRNEAARLCFAAHALQAWPNVSRLVSNVRDFSLTEATEERFI